ncbi:hypothetical protein [Photorhabdus africana]|uniref:hypothetical protein n=1 Tax=Photorhabdus africana TaxID=3097554 RepID=UPI002B40BCEB|nr:hypothetical protein [Photorhabdus sp. CRI-LC]
MVRRSTTGEHLTVQLEEVRSALKDTQEETWSLQAELLQLARQVVSFCYQLINKNTNRYTKTN